MTRFYAFADTNELTRVLKLNGCDPSEHLDFMILFGYFLDFLSPRRNVRIVCFYGICYTPDLFASGHESTKLDQRHF